MKTFRIVLVALLVAILAVVGVSAATVTYDLGVMDEEAGLYGVSFHYNMEKETTDATYATTVVGTYTTRFTFNPEKLVLMDLEEFAPVSDFTTAGLTPVVPEEYGSKYSKYAYQLADAGENSWSVGADGKVSGYITAYTQSTKFDINDTLVLNVAFILADGVTPDDLVSTDFVIDSVYIKDTGNNVQYGYNYTNVECEETLTVVNNVVPAPAVVVEDWIAGNGYNLVDMDGNVVANNSPVTKTEKSATEVTVKYGGYYQGADNWAGAALKEAVTIDGLEVEVTYTTLPTSNDCWAFIGVLAYPAIFSTNASYNNGYVNLIRYSNGNMSVYGTTKWETVGTYGDGFFALENGDVLRVCFDKNEEGTYDITYVKNNTEVFTLPIAIDLEAALGGTKGYVVASASCKGSEANAFEYTVNTNPEELAVAKIPVAAGDTVYEYVEDAGYTITKVTANGTYDIILADGDNIAVIVNSGYTSQKAYSVSKVHADGYFVEMENFANGVLGSDELSVRIRSDAPQGIRFFGTVKNVIAELDNFDEYGFIMTAESTYNALPDDYVLDMALVEAGKAKKGVAKDTAGTDIYFERTTEATVIAGVFYGVPKTVEGVKTVIASRPYYKLGDACIYGEVTKATLYDIAKLIYNVEGYEVAWEYAKEIIEIVEGPMTDDDVPELDNEIAIDVSELYK